MLSKNTGAASIFRVSALLPGVFTLLQITMNADEVSYVDIGSHISTCPFARQSGLFQPSSFVVSRIVLVHIPA
jgi:hypothetical protein